MRAIPGSPLLEGQLVFLEVGPRSELLECRVLAFLGEAVLVLPVDRPSAAAEEWLVGGSSHLLVEQDNHFKLLACTVQRAAGAFAVRVSDKFNVGQRRWWSRADLELSVRLVAQPTGPLPAVETITVDISAGGAQVRRPPGMPIWPRYELTLSGDLLARAVTLEAVAARALEDRFGLRFSRIDPSDRQQLAQLVVDHLARKALGVRA